MKETPSGFEAFLFHPDFGNEMIGGKIFVDRWTLRFQSDTTSLEIPLERLQITLGKGTDERVYFSDPRQSGVRLHVDEPTILNDGSLAQSRPVRKQLESTLGRRELFRRIRIVAWVLAVSILISWLGIWVVSAMTRAITARMPASWAADEDREGIKELKKYGLLVTNFVQTEQLKELAAPLLNILPPAERGLTIQIMEFPVPNAFAMPGGHIFVTSGLLELVESPEELLGVLAHEFAHVTQRHHYRQRIAAAGPFVIFKVFLRSDSGMSGVLTHGSGYLIQQGFSQEYESEADAVGWNYLLAANIDPRGMIGVFRKFEKIEKESAYADSVPQALRSHPALEKRITRLERRWAKVPPQTRFLTVTNQIPNLDSATSPTKLFFLRKIKRP